MTRILVAAILLLIVTSAHAVNVVRGPYLQMASDDAITIRWRTDVPDETRVRFGPAPGQLVNLTGNATLVTEHEIRITGLTPATKYHYAIEGAGGVLAGNDAEHFFKTHPVPGTVTPFRTWVLGDSGTGHYSQTPHTVAAAYRNSPGYAHPDVWLMLGDNAYGSGTDEEFQGAVFETYEEHLINTTLWSTMGNHETYNGEPVLPYYQLHTFPAAAQSGGVPSGTENYYSFDYGNAHFICLDSMTGGYRDPGSPMLTWLAADLAATTQKWIITFFHHPPFSKGSHDTDQEWEVESFQVRATVLPLLEAGGVDLVMCGHSHCYERSFLLDGHYGVSSTLTPGMILDGGDGRPGGSGAYGKDPGAHNGAVYVVAGHGARASGGQLNHPVHYTSLNMPGSFYFDIHGDQLDARMLDSTGVERDWFRISKAPQISLWTNAASRQEGGAAVKFTVTRTGSTASPLAIPLTRGGTASALDTSGIPPSVTIPAGVASEDFYAVPLADSLVEGAESVIVSATPGIFIRSGVSGSFSVLDPPHQTWLFGQFGADANDPLIAGDTADPDGDGISNLLERALGLPALGTAPSPLSFVRGADGRMAITFPRPAGTDDITYMVQVASTPGGLWSQGSSYRGSVIAPNTATTTELSRTGSAPEIITVRDNVTGAMRFIRLRVTR